jgi:hypothetical protein
LASDFATEGIDLRYVREVHVMDPWYHMNKIEQIVGRACRFCSHAALPLEKRNTTLYLHACSRPRKETVDLYAYRIAQSKFERTKDVERVLIQTSVDCALNKSRLFFNRDAINTTVQLRTSQRVNIMHRVGDDPAHRIEPKCAADSNGKQSLDESTFDIVRHTHGIEDCIQKIRELFSEVKFVEATFEELRSLRPNEFRDENTLILALDDMLNNKTIIQKKQCKDGNPEQQGYLVYRGNMYVFQPTNLHISATLQDRVASKATPKPVVFKIEPPLSTSSTTMQSSNTASSGSKLGHISRGRSKNKGKTSSNDTTKMSKHSTAVDTRNAVKWNSGAVMDSIRKRVYQLAARLPLSDYTAYVPQLIDMVVDRLKVHQLLDTCGLVISASKDAFKDTYMQLVRSSVTNGLLLFQGEVSASFAYDPLLQSFYVTRNRGRSWTPCQALDLQTALALREKRLRQLYSNPDQYLDPSQYLGYVTQTTKPTPSGVLFKVMSTRASNNATAKGCICHQTSSLTVSSIIKLIQKLDAKIVDANKSADKRNLCDVYELALRKHQPRLILRPAIHPNKKNA